MIYRYKNDRGQDLTIQCSSIVYIEKINNGVKVHTIIGEYISLGYEDKAKRDYYYNKIANLMRDSR